MDFKFCNVLLMLKPNLGFHLYPLIIKKENIFNSQNFDVFIYEHMSEHLIGVRYKLLSNSLDVRRLGPTLDKRFDGQEQCYRPKWTL